MESQNMCAETPELHIAMFPFFAFGHISPFVQLSNKLSSHGVRISFFTASGNVNRLKSVLNLTPTTQIVPLTLPPVDGLPPGLESTADTTPSTSELLKIAIDLTQPQIKTLLSQIKPNLILFDFAQTWVPQLASEFGINTIYYSVFNPSSIAFVAAVARLAEIKRIPNIEELKTPPPGFPQTLITSLKSFEAENLLYVFKSFHGGPTTLDRLIKSLKSSAAILVKNCNDIEAPYICWLKNQFNKPVLLAGAVIPEPLLGELEPRWANWLAQFPTQSVIYCSFGSETFLKDEEIQELALGLELTDLPFFLVLNFPADVDGSAELKRVLPEGFSERVKDKGVVHTGWVQQQKILAHDSVGCYVCHAGVSSVIEAVVNECQLVMLAQKGDQFLNSKLVGLELEAGVEVKRRDEDGYFGKEDICKAVRMIMVEADREPGKSIAVNHKKWREYLLNNEIQSKYISDLVKDMKKMVA